jgi:hypothetical protein
MCDRVRFPELPIALGVAYHYDRSMDRSGRQSVVKLRLTAGAAKQRVRELAQTTGNLVWTEHIQQRMAERGIDSDAVLRILRTGDVEEEPEEAKKPGDWKIKLVRMMGTGRVAGVVTVLVQTSRLVLVTTEWEDRR